MSSTDTQFKKGTIPWNKGGKLSEETKNKISESNKGKKRPPRSEEWKNKQRLVKLGKKHNHKTSNGGGWKWTDEQKKKLSIALTGKYYSSERKKAMSEGQKGKKYGDEMKRKTSERMKGEKHWNWNPNREKVAQNRTRHSLFNPEYREWRKKVYERDNYKCRLYNKECKGQLQAHHIFRWIDYPELRYIVNNGITLCHFHHPRKMEEEKRLIPIFQELVSVSN